MSASKPASELDAPPSPTDKELLVTGSEVAALATSREDDGPRAGGEGGAEPARWENGATPDDEDPHAGSQAEPMESVSAAAASEEPPGSGDSVPGPDLSPAATGSPRMARDVSSPGPKVAAAATRRDRGLPSGRGGALAEPPSGASGPAFYLVKWITWKEKRTPIITQSDNGPCPLLAIMNILFLRWKAKLPAQTEVVTTEDLMAHLGECVLSVSPREKTDGMELNFQQNMNDAMAVLPKLSTGLDVNVRFTAVTDFEYTPECIVFDLLDIPLYHGWLVDPQSPEMAAAVGKLSYNQLVEKIIDYKHSSDSARVSQGLAAEHFLETTATQLSYHGLCELNAAAKEGEMCVFFRNNHFSTMIKHKGHLYLLVTDQGFLLEEGLVWESLHNVEGDGNFCDSNFRLCHREVAAAAPLPAPSPPCPQQQPQQQQQQQQQQRQIQQDYLVAVSLQQESDGGGPGPLSDLELARQLQQEEYQHQRRPQQAGPQARVRGQGPQPGGARRREKDSDCILL